MTDHAARVAQISAQVRQRVADGRPVHIDKGGVHHVVPIPGDPRFRGGKLDSSALRHILAIDPERRVCVAEPGVSFRDVVRATLPLGLVPGVVPELEGITLGGAVAGCAVESMSYKLGGFFDSVDALELVTGTGDVLELSPTREPDLFHMVHGSYGTLGVVTRLDFRLVPAKPYVKLTYRRYHDFPGFHAALRERCAVGDYTFIDGIVHAPDHFTLCLGEFVSEAPYLSSYRWLDVFYKSTRTRARDYLTAEDYFFRYDTECHWLTRTVPGLESRPVRLLAGKFVLGSTNLIRWSNRLAPLLGRLKRRPDVVVDLFIPDRRFADFYAWYAREPRFYPLWVIPYRMPAIYPWVSDAHAARASSRSTTSRATRRPSGGSTRTPCSTAASSRSCTASGDATATCRTAPRRRARRGSGRRSSPRRRPCRAPRDAGTRPRRGRARRRHR
jgi:FAD/FMN-containing dehydrogenase